MESVDFDVEKLVEMRRPQLQKLCKNLGIKANSKTSQLIADLKEYAKTHSSEANEKPKTPAPKTPEVHVQETMCQDGRQEFPSPLEVKVMDDNSDDKSYKEQIMEQLEKKVQETLKESKIPRLASRTVTFTIGSNSTPPKNTIKEHSAFKKMDSIDVYLEKKRKRTQSFYTNVKKAKTVANKARNIIADIKASHNTPARESPRQKRRKSTKTVDLHVPTSFSFGHLKSPKIVKPVVAFGQDKQKTPALSRKSLSAASKAKENKTPSCTSRKSIAVTPFRCNTTLDTTSSVSTKNKFDLQASLSKPLAYKPHKGKLEKFSFVKKESKIPVKVNKKPLTDHKVEVKNVKITSRAARMQNNRCSRADKRRNALLARRGLAN